jgi:type IV secretion system protein VirB4
MQGAYFPLGAEKCPLSLQPLRDIDTASGVAWAREWLHDIVTQEGCDLTGEVKQEIWRALVSLSCASAGQRTVTMFHDLVQHLEVKAALQPFTSAGPFGSLVDGADSPSSHARWQTFEMSELMEKPSAVAPVLTYLFHHLEGKFDGRPTLLILDEAWLFLDNTLFSRKIRDWLKTLRKRNVAVLFATQSLSDIENSSLKAILLESCPTKIFLPNPESESSSQSAIYKNFGLNDRQINIICRSSPKKHYYVHCASGSRLIDLSLGPFQKSVLTCSSPEDHRFLDYLETTSSATRFAADFMRAKGL